MLTERPDAEVVQRTRNGQMEQAPPKSARPAPSGE